MHNSFIFSTFAATNQILSIMYINRAIDRALLEWKEKSNRKPLLLRGARQIGKSTAVRQLGKQFDYYIEANFEKNSSLKSLFTSNLAVKDIAAGIGNLYSTPIVPGKTLLFLDEIQSCPEAIHSLWFFKEDFPELHVVAAGSLLELALKEDTQTYGVGRIQSLYMYPLSFDEFLVATGHSMWVSAKQIANANQPVQEALHEQLTNSFRTFLMTGGMPASVVAWLETNDYLASQEEIENIADSYYEDFKKYAKKISPDLLTAVLQSAVLQIGSKFVYSHVEGGYSIYDIKKALGFLCDAGILSQVQHTAANGLPLGVEINKKFTKYILLDSGLLLCLLNMNMGSRQQITEDILTATATDLINKGSLTEMVAGLEQIKYASPKRKYPLYYWENLAKGTTAEVDYILSRDMQIVPLEVKAGTSGKMKSLRFFMEKKKITHAIRCSLENFSRLENDGIDIIPLYALSNLFRD